MLSFVEVQEMEENLPKTCKIDFDDPDKIHKFILTITPDEGFWYGGKYRFIVNVPDDYNIVVRIKRKCFLY